MNDRDALQQQAIRLFNDLSRIQKQAKKAAQCERGVLEARAMQISRELRVVVDKHQKVTP